jgi:hypothetical protein
VAVGIVEKESKRRAEIVIAQEYPEPIPGPRVLGGAAFVSTTEPPWINRSIALNVANGAR